MTRLDARLEKSIHPIEQTGRKRIKVENVDPMDWPEPTVQHGAMISKSKWLESTHPVFDSNTEITIIPIPFDPLRHVPIPPSVLSAPHFYSFSPTTNCSALYPIPNAESAKRVNQIKKARGKQKEILYFITKNARPKPKWSDSADSPISLSCSPRLVSSSPLLSLSPFPPQTQLSDSLQKP